MSETPQINQLPKSGTQPLPTTSQKEIIKQPDGYRGEGIQNLTSPSWEQQADEAEIADALKHGAPHEKLQALANLGTLETQELMPDKAKRLAEATKKEFYACQGKFGTSDTGTIPYKTVREYPDNPQGSNDVTVSTELQKRGFDTLHEEGVLLQPMVKSTGMANEAFRMWTIAKAKEDGYVQINYYFPVDKSYDGVAKREVAVRYIVIVPEALGNQIQSAFDENSNFAEAYLEAMDSKVAHMEKPDAYAIIARDLRKSPDPELKMLKHENEEAENQVYKMPEYIRKKQAFLEFAKAQNLDSNATYTKGELRKRGFAMANRIGNGERAMINIIDGQNVSNDFFLTQAQLDQHRRESLPEGITPAELPKIEEDMGNFMQEVRSAVGVNIILTDEDRMLPYVIMFLDDLEGEYPELIGKREALRENKKYYEQEIVEQVVATLKENYKIPDSVRGISVTDLTGRAEGTNIAPCPCMDCSAHFPNENGIKIYDDGSITGTPGVLRMNSITRHLAGHGITNNGNDLVQDRDQRYMTLKDYMSIYTRRASVNVATVPLDPDQVEQELVNAVLRSTLKEFGLQDKVTDERVDKAVKEYLFLE